MVKCMFCDVQIFLNKPDFGRMMETINKYSSGLNNVYKCYNCDAYFVPQYSNSKMEMACYEFILDKYRIFASEPDNFTEVHDIQVWNYKDNMKQRNGAVSVPETITVYKKVLTMPHIKFHSRQDFLNKIKKMLMFI